MTLTRYKLGDLIEQVDERNNDKWDASRVVGISTNKNFIETKANLDGVSLKSYKIVLPYSFAYVADTSRRGDKISLSYNFTENELLVSSISTIFKVKNDGELNSEFLFMYFNRPEFDRYARYNSWGSARETFSWEDLCDIDIDLPPLHIQEKYVAIYQAMLDNQRAYENGLEDLKLVCDATIEKLRREMPSKKIGPYIEQIDTQNSEGFQTSDVVGISTNKEFIETKAKLDGVNLDKYKVVPVDSYAFVSDTSRRGEKISLAYNNSNKEYLVSSISTVFGVKHDMDLLSEFLFLFFHRDEFDRYARFHSWGSARETFTWNDLCEVKIPIPPLDIQQSIVDIYNAYTTRKEINEQLKQQLKDICPILIAGAIKEAKEHGEV